jgi:hypothetical protein
MPVRIVFFNDTGKTAAFQNILLASGRFFKIMQIKMISSGDAILPSHKIKYFSEKL